MAILNTHPLYVDVSSQDCRRPMTSCESNVLSVRAAEVGAPAAAATAASTTIVRMFSVAAHTAAEREETEMSMFQPSWL